MEDLAISDVQKGVAGTGLGLGIAGTALGLMAGGLNGGNGIGGIGFGCNNQAAGAAANEISKLRSEIATLKGEKYSDGKTQELYNFITAENKELTKFLFDFDKRLTTVETAAPLREQILRGEIAQVAQTANCCCQQLTAQLTALNATVAQITKIGVPNSVLYPGVPNVYLTHTAPTTTT
jgi:hypothetical protein